MKKHRIAGLLVALAVFTACHDEGSNTEAGAAPSSGGGGASGLGGAAGSSNLPTFSSGLDPTKVVAQLTSAERRGLCTADISWQLTPQNVSAWCEYMRIALAWVTFDGIAGDEAKARGACKESSDKCLSGEKYAITNCDKITPTCNITVGEYEKCRDEMLASMKAFGDKQPTCDMLNASYLAGIASALEAARSPPSCTAAGAKCPGISMSLK